MPRLGTSSGNEPSACNRLLTKFTSTKAHQSISSDAFSTVNTDHGVYEASSYGTCISKYSWLFHGTNKESKRWCRSEKCCLAAHVVQIAIGSAFVPSYICVNPQLRAFTLILGCFSMQRSRLSLQSSTMPSYHIHKLFGMFNAYKHTMSDHPASGATHLLTVSTLDPRAQ